MYLQDVSSRVLSDLFKFFEAPSYEFSKYVEIGLLISLNCLESSGVWESWARAPSPKITKMKGFGFSQSAIEKLLVEK